MWLRKTKHTIFRNRGDVVKSMVIFAIANIMISSSFFAVRNLQSSLNIESGLGVTTLALFSASMVISGVILSPILAKSISARTSFILSDILQICLAVANVYPKFFTMLPASCITGFGRGLFWIQSAMFSVFYSKMLTKTGTGKFTSYFSKTNGCFFAVIASGQVLGNLIPFLVLELNKSNETKDLSMNQTFNSSDSYLLSTTTRYSTKDVCGANDCQDPSVIQEASSNFQPSNKNVLYLLWGILIGIHVIGTVLHILFLPLFADVDIDNDVVCRQCQKQGAANEMFFQDDRETDIRMKDTEKIRYVSDIVKDKEKHHNENNADISLVDKSTERITNQLSPKNSNKIGLYVEQLKVTFQCFLKPSHLLLAGINFHYGLSGSFITSEVSRAFVSCVYGVGKVGISMAIYGTSITIFSFTTGKVSAKYGRKLCVGFGSVVSMSISIVFLLWIPDENTNIGITYFLYFLYGICDAVFQTITTETAIIHHTANTQAAYSCWLTWSSLGFIVQFSWSTSVCVRYKLYVMIILLIFGVVTYGIAEYKYKQRKQLKQKTSSVKASV